MHQTLFSRTLKILKNQTKPDTLNQEHRAMLKKDVLQLSLGNLPEEEVEAHFSLLPERYFVNTSANEAILHLNMINRLLSQIQNADSIGSLSPIIDWRDDKNLGMSVINIVTWDRAGLFYKLAGALTLSELAIISTRAISRKDHITIDTFYVVDLDGKYVSDPKIKNTFKEKVENALVHGKDLTEEINTLEQKYLQASIKESQLPSPFPPSVEVYHELSLHRTIIEVQAKDQIGLLFKITRLITDKGFDISFARIATERGIAMDTFYIENLNLNESTNTSDLLEVRAEIEAIIQSCE
jgi:[protein-PII] uridylyltransferase